jgi:hypothetical protein
VKNNKEAYFIFKVDKKYEKMHTIIDRELQIGNK